MSSTFAETSSWDVVFKSTDGVLFYVDSTKLPHGAFPSVARSASGERVAVDVIEASAVLNVILHALYDTAYTAQSPSIDLLDESIDRMPFHGINPTSCIVIGCVAYRLLSTLAQDHAFRVYALAASHKLHDLAIEASQYTLTFPLAGCSDEHAERMGAIYYKRLIYLHHNRKHMLRDIITFSPSPHPRTETCGNDEYISLTRAWSLRVAELLLSDSELGGLTVDYLHDWFMTLESDLVCVLCVETLKSRINGLMSKWALTKNTI